MELARTGQRHLKMLVFGYSGAGKSYLALSFCFDRRTAPVYWLDASGSTEGLRERVPPGSTVRTCEDSKSVLAHVEWVLAHPGRFRTVVIDDFSEMFNLTMGAVAKAKMRGSPDNLEGRDYPAVYERTRAVLRLLRKAANPIEAGGAGIHYLVTCWPKERERPAESGDVGQWLVPQLAGEFSHGIAGYFDIVAYLKHRWITQRDGKEVSLVFRNDLILADSGLLVKDRFSALPTKMRLPTATSIVDAIENSVAAVQLDATLAQHTETKE